MIKELILQSHQVILLKIGGLDDAIDTQIKLLQCFTFETFTIALARPILFTGFIMTGEHRSPRGGTGTQ
ncbi:hypothetical protein [Modicisalibacter ilicicola]|uniref:hypothetical protein n=1 Tax=Modicisalibacter ilicicola TaxID=480814 RepID=UPI0009330909|nr:hypothetical protein [Halomonas ilicicola]